MPKKFNDEASFNSVIDAYRTVHQRCPNFRLDQLDLPESMRQATKLLLKLLDSLDAIRVSFSDLLGRDGRPALTAWYNRNRD